METWLIVVLIANSFITAGAYILLLGWTYAFWYGEFPDFPEKYREDDWFFCMWWVIIFALIWPLGVPFVWHVITERAKHGWRMR